MNLPPAPPRHPPPPSRPPLNPNTYVVPYNRGSLLGGSLFAVVWSCLVLSFIADSEDTPWPTLILGLSAVIALGCAAWTICVVLTGVPWLVVDTAGIHVRPMFRRGRRSRPWAQVDAVRTWTEIRERENSSFTVTCLEIVGSTPPSLTFKSTSVRLDTARLHRAVALFAPHVQVVRT